MSKIIFFILPFFVFNFYEDFFESKDTYIMDLKYFQRIFNEYLIIYVDSNRQTNFARVNSTTLNVNAKGRLFADEMKYFLTFLKLEYRLILVMSITKFKIKLIVEILY